MNLRKQLVKSKKKKFKALSLKFQNSMREHYIPFDSTSKDGLKFLGLMYNAYVRCKKLGLNEEDSYVQATFIASLEIQPRFVAETFEERENIYEDNKYFDCPGDEDIDLFDDTIEYDGI